VAVTGLILSLGLSLQQAVVKVVAVANLLVEMVALVGLAEVQTLVDQVVLVQLVREMLEE
jgi:hypothetical protein